MSTIVTAAQVDRLREKIVEHVRRRLEVGREAEREVAAVVEAIVADLGGTGTLQIRWLRLELDEYAWQAISADRRGVDPPDVDLVACTVLVVLGLDAPEGTFS